MILTAKPASAGAFRLKRGTKSTANTTLSLDGLPPLASIDGPFQLAEYLALKVRADTHDVAGLVEVPAEGRSTDRDVWIYEHLRRLPIDLTPLISQLLSHCTKESCPEMKADQWQYLCVAHGSGVSEDCCAIDYILHTLDSATAILNSSKNFPSRMSIPPGSLSHFPSLSRRLSRIFSHAYFHHREQFLLSESETSLYARFVALCEAYGLVGKELLIIPNPSAKDSLVDEEEDDAEEEEAVDAEEDEERSRDKDKGASKRTLSLDRQSGVGVKVLSREKGKGKMTEAEIAAGEVSGGRSEPKSAEDASKAEPAALPVPATPAPTSLLPKKAADDATGPNAATSKKVGTIGRGTKGKGKQGRGTVLWSSDSADVPPMPDVPAVPELPAGYNGTELARTESQDSAVFIGDEDSSGGTTESSEKARPSNEVSSVPKDEIELLEKAGKLEPEASVSPLPPTAAALDSAGPAIDEKSASGAEEPPAGNSITLADSGQVEAATMKTAEPVIISPKPPTAKFSPTAAAPPLNPPRNLSRSPEARNKALAGSDGTSPSRKAKDEASANSSGLTKIIKAPAVGDELDAEGSKAIVADVPARIGSPIAIKKGEGAEVKADIAQV